MTAPPDPETLPPVFPVLVASSVLGIGKNQTYQLLSKGEYPVRVRRISGHWKVSRWDLLRYLGVLAEPDGDEPARHLRPAEGAA